MHALQNGNRQEVLKFAIKPKMGKRIRLVDEKASEARASEHRARERCRELEALQEEDRGRVMVLAGIWLALVVAWVVVGDLW